MCIGDLEARGLLTNGSSKSSSLVSRSFSSFFIGDLEALGCIFIFLANGNSRSSSLVSRSYSLFLVNHLLFGLLLFPFAIFGSRLPGSRIFIGDTLGGVFSRSGETSLGGVAGGRGVAGGGV